jgi:hypothetical protein
LGGPGGEHVRAAKGSYETGEREELRDYTDYIDAPLTESGIDVEALAARLGTGVS